MDWTKMIIGALVQGAVLTVILALVTPFLAGIFPQFVIAINGLGNLVAYTVTLGVGSFLLTWLKKAVPSIGTWM